MLRVVLLVSFQHLQLLPQLIGLVLELGLAETLLFPALLCVVEQSRQLAHSLSSLQVVLMGVAAALVQDLEYLFVPFAKVLDNTSSVCTVGSNLNNKQVQWACCCALSMGQKHWHWGSYGLGVARQASSPGDPTLS